MRPVPVLSDYLEKLVIPASRAILKLAVIYRFVSLVEYDLNRFFAIFGDFLRFFPTNQITHRHKTGEDLEHVPLS